MTGNLLSCLALVRYRSIVVHCRPTVGPLSVHCRSTVGPMWPSVVHCLSTVGPLSVRYGSCRFALVYYRSAVSTVCPLSVHCRSVMVAVGWLWSTVGPLSVHCRPTVGPLSVRSGLLSVHYRSAACPRFARCRGRWLARCLPAAFPF